MDTFGRHLLAEYRGASAAVLTDVDAIETLMKRAAIEAGATIVQSVFHRFTPQGVSGVVVVEESHLSIHTWPELGYAAADFYTCGDCVPDEAHRVLAEGLEATDHELLIVHRGGNPMSGTGPSMSVKMHLRPDTRTEVVRPARLLAHGGFVR